MPKQACQSIEVLNTHTLLQLIKLLNSDNILQTTKKISMSTRKSNSDSNIYICSILNGERCQQMSVNTRLTFATASHVFTVSYQALSRVFNLNVCSTKCKICSGY